MIHFLFFLFFIVSVNSSQLMDLPLLTNKAHYRFVATMNHTKVFRRFTTCHKCPFTQLMTNIGDKPGKYVDFDMEIDQELMVVHEDTKTPQLMSFQEHGVYTLQLNSTSGHIVVQSIDREGHFYLIPFYTYIGVTVLAVILLNIHDKHIKGNMCKWFHSLCKSCSHSAAEPVTDPLDQSLLAMEASTTTTTTTTTTATTTTTTPPARVQTPPADLPVTQVPALPLQESLSTPVVTKAEKSPASWTESKDRIRSIDVFRGMDLCMMIFANYGCAGYHILEHTEWDGLHLADFAFPIFVLIQGMTLRVSIIRTFDLFMSKGNSPLKSTWMTVWKCLKRALILLVLTWTSNGNTQAKSFRILGVLAYFSVSGFVNSLVLLFTPVWHTTHKLISRWRANSEFKGSADCKFYFDWVIPVLFALFYIVMLTWVSFPGCPAGYHGPGGFSEDHKYEGCTGGILRYVDLKILTEPHMYQYSSVMSLYGGQVFEPEGVMGLCNAIFIAYLGTLVTLIQCRTKDRRKQCLAFFGLGILFFIGAGLLCGFKRYDGFMPMNKYKWTTSFVLCAAGAGYVSYGVVFALVDMWKLWTGVPYIAIGMNSILFYIAHEFMGNTFPFGWNFPENDHWHQMLSRYVFPQAAWLIIANFFMKQKTFLKI